MKRARDREEREGEGDHAPTNVWMGDGKSTGEGEKGRYLPAFSPPSRLHRATTYPPSRASYVRSAASPSLTRQPLLARPALRREPSL